MIYPSIPPCRGDEQGIVQEKVDGFNVGIVATKNGIILQTRRQRYMPHTFPYDLSFDETKFHKLLDLLDADTIYVFGELIGMRTRYRTRQRYFVFDLVIQRDDEYLVVPPRSIHTFAEILDLPYVPTLDAVPQEKFVSRIDGVTPAEGYVIKEPDLVIGGEDVLLKRRICKKRFVEMVNQVDWKSAPLWANL